MLKYALLFVTSLILASCSTLNTQNTESLVMKRMVDATVLVSIGQGHGSGVVISRGVIITARHVVTTDPNRQPVTITNRKG